MVVRDLSKKAIPFTLKYGAMPLEKRKKVVTQRSVCSLYPSQDYADAVSTGNGFQRVDILGDPYCDELAF